MIELMAVLAIMGLGIAALLQTLVGGLYYARDTENNIKAINLAREGIEWVINIRDTNWLRFSSDKVNCWKVDGYVATCIGNTSGPVIASWSYILYAKNGAWFLSWSTSSDPLTNWSNYKNNFAVWLDSGWFFTQTGVTSTACSSWVQSSCRTIFTREIKIQYSPTNTGSMQVISTVNWLDKRPQQVTVDTILTNWKSNF